MASSEQRQSWLFDQLTKSEFFHQKLHEYGLLDVADTIERIQGEELQWVLEDLEISQVAWSKVIHRGIKPVRVFAHPTVLQKVHRSVGYYQGLAMVSLKSMANVGLAVDRYVSGENKKPMGEGKAIAVSCRLNELISRLIETDQVLDPREFDLWRAMTAGATAQGSWQNRKGDRTEDVIKGIVARRIQDRDLLKAQSKGGSEWRLRDGRIIRYSSEPDIAFYDGYDEVLFAVEVKGGIDTAGVLERIGAAIKSLSRVKQQNNMATTILIIPAVSITEQAEQELYAHQSDIDHWFTVEGVLNKADVRERVFEILDI